MRKLVFIGTYTEDILFGTGQILKGKGEGIYILELMQDTGELRFVNLIKGVRNPSYLAFHPSKKFMYCVNEFKEFEGMASGGVSAYAIDSSNTELTFLNTKPSHGTDPCHLAVDPTGKFLFVANFASGSVSAYPIKPDGSLDDASDVIQHEGSSIDPVRQVGPHAHAATIDIQGKFLYVPDLGLDEVKIYEVDPIKGKLKDTPTKYITTVPGAGPRQVVMHPNDNYAYLVNELNSTMTAYHYSKDTGALEELHTLSTLPKGFQGESSCAEVQIHPSGKFLFGSNRGHNSIVSYSIDEETGTLKLVGHTHTKGEIPRNFVVSHDGIYLLAANQDSDNIVVFKIDEKTGELQDLKSEYHIPTPVCIKFL